MQNLTQRPTKTINLAGKFAHHWTYQLSRIPLSDLVGASKNNETAKIDNMFGTTLEVGMLESFSDFLMLLYAKRSNLC